MDVQIPHPASSGMANSTNSQVASRPAQEATRRESAGSNKSFLSELRNARTTKETRQEIGRIRSNHTEHRAEHEERDTATLSDDAAAPTSASKLSSSTTEDKHANDKESEPAPQKSDTAALPVMNDVTTQSVILAMIAQPAGTPNTPSPAQASAGESAKTAVGSVMLPVMEDGTALPGTAPDSSNLSEAAAPNMTGQSTTLVAAAPSGSIIPPVTQASGQSTASPQEETTLQSQSQLTPEELRAAQMEKPAVPLEHQEDAHEPVKVEVKAQPVGIQQDGRNVVSDPRPTVAPLTAEQPPVPSENRPMMMERPAPIHEVPVPKEEASPNQAALASIAGQDFSKGENESGTEWSGRDHRERSSNEQAVMQPLIAEAPAVPSNASLTVNGVDQRAFTSAPSAKLPAETHPTPAAPTVQPTDWLPGNASGQTKSMVLELSQADLGRVNIRVAVNQELVHTHLSSDRNDMGQYLVNGQDKLQTALQTSGLDLGRFQVDIDRQSAGRSFQQQTSQEHFHGNTPQGQNQSQGQGREELPRSTTSRRGVLNLVA